MILKIFHCCVFWILPCNGSLFEHVGLEEGSSPAMLLSLFKWLCGFSTRGHVQVVAAPTLAVPCLGGTFPLHLEPGLWLCDSGTRPGQGWAMGEQHEEIWFCACVPARASSVCRSERCCPNVFCAVSGRDQGICTGIPWVSSGSAKLCWPWLWMWH